MLNNIQAHNHSVHDYLQAHRTDPTQGVSTVQPVACLHSHKSLLRDTHNHTYRNDDRHSANDTVYGRYK
jgi:hypothetical protein